MIEKKRPAHGIPLHALRAIVELADAIPCADLVDPRGAWNRHAPLINDARAIVASFDRLLTEGREIRRARGEDS